MLVTKFSESGVELVFGQIAPPKTLTLKGLTWN
jgi:hypothetical protein